MVIVLSGLSIGNIGKKVTVSPFIFFVRYNSDLSGILDEVRHYSADIIALQEVETDQFYKFFLPELKRDG